jgi:hypothetical protein
MSKHTKVKVVTAVSIDGSKYFRATGAARAWAEAVLRERFRQRKQSLSHADYLAWLGAQQRASSVTTTGLVSMVDEWAMVAKAYRRALPIFQRILP